MEEKKANSSRTESDLAPENHGQSGSTKNVGRSTRKVVPANENVRQKSVMAMSKAAEDAELAVISGSAPPPKREPFLIDPNSTQRNVWDFLVIFALLYVASITPYQTAFLSDKDTGFVVSDRVVDVIFAVDIALNFLTPFQTANGVWVYSHKAIAINYATSWLVIDILSVIPLDMIKLVRLLRLAKLLRIFRASRVLKRWESRISISFGAITLAKFVLYMMMLAHWLACLLGLVVDDSEESNWLKDYSALDIDANAFEKYNVALYWAVMTVTTIGYGDVAMKTDLERWVGIFAMLIGGSAYAYIVGSVCGLVASMGEVQAILHRKIDDLNVFMEEQKLPHNLRISLREYFLYTAKQARNDSFASLLEEMSPGMRDDIFYRTRSFWVKCIPFVHCASPFEKKYFITALAQKLVQVIYPPKERMIRPGTIAKHMYIIEKGVVMMNKTYFVQPDVDEEEDVKVVNLSSTLRAAEKIILTRGRAFGDDFVLSDSRRRYHCTSLTFVELHLLSREALFDIIDDANFPETQKEFRKYVIKLAFRTKFVSLSRIYRAKRRQFERLSVTLTPQEQEELFKKIFSTMSNIS